MLSGAGMVHRIDIGPRAATSPTIEFQGQLDGAALMEIRRHVRGLASAGHRVRLVLKTGTEVDPACVDALKTLEAVELLPEAGFLARWLGIRPGNP